VIPQSWQWISQSHFMSNRCWNMGFICECWNQIADKTVDAHTFTKQTKKKSLNKRLAESWWQLFSGTGKECWWWNLCNMGPQ
jgi:hypothetical protein